MEKTFTIRNRGDQVSLDLSLRLEESLCKAGYVKCEECCHYVFVIGGDGTFLKSVHEFMDRLDEVVFYGLHTGTLGFLMDFDEPHFEEYLNRFLNNDLKMSQYPLLEVTLDGKEPHYAVNEVRIENITRTQTMDISINDEFFETYRGTGICVCGQLGSSAYNRSLGGAVVQDGLNVLQLSEISGIHHRAYRSLGASLIMKDNAIIHISSKDFSDAVLGFDSNVLLLDDFHEVEIKMCCKHVIHVLRGKDVSYFTRLQALF